ncbi:MAG: ABC transporter substrate-binding protein [Oscillospiraceae bacterium]
MKKFVSLIVALCVVIAIFVACGGGGGKVEQKSVLKSVENKNIIEIGVFEPLSGKNSEGGIQETLGIQYANSICPTVDVKGVTYDIKLVEADNLSSEAGAVSAAESLVNAGVCAAIGSYGSALSIAGGEIFDKAGIPIVGASCTAPEVTVGNKSYFRISYLDSFQASVMAKFAFDKGLRDAAIMSNSDDKCEAGLVKAFKKEFTDLGGRTEEFTYPQSQSNFDPLLRKIKSSEADFVFSPSAVSAAPLIIKQARSNGLNFPFLGCDTWDTSFVVKKLNTYGKNVFFCSGFNQDSTDVPETAEFAALFSAWLNETKSRIEDNGGSDSVAPASALAYDAYMAIIEAIKSAESTDAKAIAAALPAVTMKGVTGEIAFDENGDAGKYTAYIKTLNSSKNSTEVLQSISVGK